MPAGSVAFWLRPASVTASALVPCTLPSRCCKMAPHLSNSELDIVTTMNQQGKGTDKILDRIVRGRRRQGVEPPGLQAIQRAVGGETFKRGLQETRGRKRAWSPAHTRKADAARRKLYAKADGEQEIRWKDIISKARVPKVSSTTARRHFKDSGVPIVARHPREKPLRDTEVKEERVVMCKVIVKKPNKYYSHKVDAIWDNKYWEIPRSAAAKKYRNMRQVRFHLRTRSEGLNPGFTKPNNKRNRVNPGASANICAGIIGNRVRIWHYIPKRWNGAEAAALYRGPIIKALRRYRGQKRSYKVIEDNDPSGYKSSKGKEAKRELKIIPEAWPRYSPDLMPMDYSIWQLVKNRMDKHKPPKNETVGQYKARLRRTALNLPAKLVQKVVAGIQKRAAAIVEAKGGNISCD